MANPQVTSSWNRATQLCAEESAPLSRPHEFSELEDDCIEWSRRNPLTLTDTERPDFDPEGQQLADLCSRLHPVHPSAGADFLERHFVATFLAFAAIAIAALLWLPGFKS